MVASPRLQALLAERAQRSARKGLLATVVAGLRSPQAAHPKQMAALRSRAKRRAKLCTRRSGKTSGGNREDLARALEQPGWRGTYCHTTRGEAKKLAWRSDTNDGWCDLLQQHGELTDPRRGTWTVAGVEATINESELTISFSNGSLLDIFAADDPASAQKFRGRAKHKVRIDEAQQFPDLQRFCVAIVGPTLRDFDGELELDGTPGEDCSGYYYEITKPDTHGERIVGWEVHSFGVTDNPFFGSTSEERWARTAAVALEENGWTGDEPEFQREWLGHWVRAGANFVYAVHSAPPTSIGFAPLRRGDSWRAHATQVRGMTSQALEAAMEHGWYDHEASVRDLPQRRGRRWTFGLGVDFGHSPDPVALSIPAIASDLPEVYEMWSWKKVGLVPDDWRCLIELVYLQLGNDLIGIVGDPGGLVEIGRAHV